MGCDEIRGKLWDARLGLLDDTAELEAHARGCVECRREQDRAARALDVLQAWQPQVPSLRGRRRRLWEFPAAAAILVFAALGAWLVSTLKTPQPQNDPITVDAGDVWPEDDKTITLYLDKDRKVVMKFVRIKPGEFVMGSPEGEEGREPDEKQHKVKLTKPYWMQTTPVTQGQWEAVMGNNPSHFKGDANLPVEQVNWDDCQEFLKKLNEKCRGRLGGKVADLPTEAQWEYACRAGSKERWCFGEDESKLDEYAWYYRNSGKKTHPVGEKKPNAWGLYDIHGNVWQWCKDWYEENLMDAVDPQGPETGLNRVVRGGSWEGGPRYSRSADRIRFGLTNRSHYVGARVALRRSQ